MSTNVNGIEIHTGNIDVPYKKIRQIEAVCEAGSALLAAPTIEQVNFKLVELALKVGANAVINVEYNSGISLTSWKSLKATGLAILKESEEIKCPVCAETIKRAAIKCRFCGAEIEQSKPSDYNTCNTTDNKEPFISEPLKSNDNSIMLWVTLGGGVLAIIWMLIIMTSF